MSEPTGSPHTPSYGEVDLSTCDREPIHIPGAIQPHGVLLALDGDHQVRMASANSATLLGVGPDDALGHPLADVVGEAAAGAIIEREAAGLPKTPLVLHLDEGTEVDVHVHRSGARLVIELEPLAAPDRAALSYHTARGAMSRMAGAASVHELAGHLAHEVREITAFDRVMVYRFDPEWNGEVIAEERRADLNPFLGLHYPSTDIPAQARRLYTVNWTRLIADTGYEPVPLHPVFDPGTGAPLDLSFATLRSVSPIHLEYLSNMGVTASMSVSIVVEDRLWGLVACHHYSGPHRPSHDARAAAEFLGQVASQVVVDRERADAREAALETQSMMAGITARITAGARSPLESLIEDPELLSLMDAEGAALCYDGVLTVRGTVADETTLRRVAAALESPLSYATQTDNVAALLPDLAGVPEVAGVMRVGSAEDRWLLWLRPQQERVVDWGGDPTNKLIAASEGPEVRLSPRKSFEKWRQVVSGRSLPWTPWQVDAADALGKHMQGLLLMRSREQIAMAESVQRSVVLDRAPAFPGLEVAARYLPATTYQLGGDWWDAFELPDGRIALAVGDVAGHGVSAASAMTQIRTALRAYVFEGHDPAACLDRLDRLMDGLLDQRVATAAVAVLDPATGRMRIAGAGHPQPLLVRDGDAVEVGVVSRPLLGVGWGTSTSTDLVLEPGTTLLVYTDGLVEERGVDMAERMDHLRRLAADTHPGVDIDQWIDGLLAVQGDRPDDDTTLLAVRVTP
ncbi:SpoIIE family protein phosphatase [Nocardioides sp. URHA0032]|uniref:SpoIIE family protein phosphatase n=1 Tax=Nocardioides sp. URHA0032 TaxID=1380388 RepID=UPI00048C13DB|nr:SpoIIE family protein phosphatase [Nocardioides sp. URHA0032]